MSKSNYQQEIHKAFDVLLDSLNVSLASRERVHREADKALTQLIDSAIAEELENALLSSNPNYIADRLKELKGGEHE